MEHGTTMTKTYKEFMAESKVSRSGRADLHVKPADKDGHHIVVKVNHKDLDLEPGDSIHKRLIKNGKYTGGYSVKIHKE